MAKYKPQHARLLFIDQQIREHRYPNCTSLAKQWEVSDRTIHRDIDYMRYELNAPLEYSAKDRGYWYTEAQYHLPAMDIRESDLFAIYLADKLLLQYEGTPIYDGLCSVFRKIEDSLPEKAGAKPVGDQSLFAVFPPFCTVIMPAVMETVFDCLRTSTRMEIEYRNPGAATVKRQVDPYQGVRFEGDWYVVAYCHLRQAIRTFSLARMVKVKKEQQQFTRPADFDFGRLSGSHFGVHWGTDEVRVRILFTTEAAAYVRERQWHPSQQLDEQEDGSIILTLTVNHLLELKRWILSWGALARVLEPAVLADAMRTAAQEMVRRYAEPS